MVPGYAYQRRCPNAQNLIAIVGDANGDGVCDDKCNLQIEGTGADPSQVVITGDRSKLNIIRADRADGILLRNFTIQYSDFNNIYVVETNGFRLDRIVSRWSREYDFLTFTSDHGLYENLVAYGAGDAGIYPGSGPEGHCARYGIEIRNVNSYGNTFGLSGNSGNGLWIHDDSFHDNAVGVLVGSLGPGHPGQPQDCSKFEHNRIYSNNLNVYAPERAAACQRPTLDRDPTEICPAAPAPVGTGLMILGGNRNLVEDNAVYDNWRAGVRLGWVPVQKGNVPGAPDGLRSLMLVLNNLPSVFNPETPDGNRFLDNRMGVRPDGRRARNGVDFQWDRVGRRNCWSGNYTAVGSPLTSRPRRLSACPGRSFTLPPSPAVVHELLKCSSWRPATNPHPSGCSWFIARRKPSLSAGTSSSSSRLFHILVAASALAAITSVATGGYLLKRKRGE